MKMSFHDHVEQFPGQEQANYSGMKSIDKQAAWSCLTAQQIYNGKAIKLCNRTQCAGRRPAASCWPGRRATGRLVASNDMTLL